ncbi:hepatoma-derived growth factor-related protein 2-like [Panicum miliaceum]|uniref:Hepatoma-derived growth factor-related protein 2-like n=1 Tax=Panicum miliaceum TaxID=4540 RepID=A0A3L6Q8J8_PANMI|nr:hepatoma-derived growth factor-related protein 2-like [Panicum miliaceum]
MASSPVPSPRGEGGTSAGAVCCMCGDQGLPGELFHCRRCRARLQHRYCSDLYPRAAAYRRCNWCMREPAPDHGGRPAHAAAAVASSKPEEKRKTATASDEESQRQRLEGCSSRRPPAEPGRPVKKKRKAQEKMPPPPPPPPQPKEIIIGDASGREELMRAGKTRVNRVRVRRYKLLAEVISCS